MVSGQCWIETRLCDVFGLFNEYMDGVDSEMKVRVLGKELQLHGANGGMV